MTSRRAEKSGFYGVLHALEIGGKRTGQGFGDNRFADAGHIVQQQVAARDQNCDGLGLGLDGRRRWIEYHSRVVFLPTQVT